MGKPLTIEGIEQEVAYYSGYVLRGINFSKRDDGWLMIVKVDGKRGKPLVTFIHAPTPAECMEVMEQALRTRHYTLKWREDKFIKA